jgi:hypothetical protein
LSQRMVSLTRMVQLLLSGLGTEHTPDPGGPHPFFP